MYLENEGFFVVSCNDGESAYNIIKNEKIDLAIFDIMMPKLNGYELTKRVRNMYW